jgi:hypothetical protein
VSTGLNPSPPVPELPPVAAELQRNARYQATFANRTLLGGSTNAGMIGRRLYQWCDDHCLSHQDAGHAHEHAVLERRGARECDVSYWFIRRGVDGGAIQTFSSLPHALLAACPAYRFAPRSRPNRRNFKI